MREREEHLLSTGREELEKEEMEKLVIVKKEEKKKKNIKYEKKLLSILI